MAFPSQAPHQVLGARGAHLVPGDHADQRHLPIRAQEATGDLADLGGAGHTACRQEVGRTGDAGHLRVAGDGRLQGAQGGDLAGLEQAAGALMLDQYLDGVRGAGEVGLHEEGPGDRLLSLRLVLQAALGEAELGAGVGQRQQDGQGQPARQDRLADDGRGQGMPEAGLPGAQEAAGYHPQAVHLGAEHPQQGGEQGHGHQQRGEGDQQAAQAHRGESSS
jgi:hypothetical protein